MRELSENDRVVYRLVREAARRGERPTVSEVARAAGMARSSVAHVATRLGYRGWVDFTSQLARYFAVAGSEDLASDSVRIVAEELMAARPSAVLVDAIGDAEICGDHLVVRLCERGFRAAPFSPGVAGALGGEGEGAGVLAVINESGMSLLPSCLAAAEQGYRIVAVTGSHDTPISKLADVNVVIKSNKSVVERYEPNYFTAGVLVFWERVLAALDRA